LLQDNVTINLTQGAAALRSCILAQAGANRATCTYTDFRAALAADMLSATDALAVSSLGSGSNFGVLINGINDSPDGAGSATPTIDTAGANTRTARLTTANAEALCLAVTATSDASITVGSGFAYDYEPGNGATAGTCDLVGPATHEIGHALGFLSGVDTLDANGRGGFSSDVFTYVNSFDLFRCSALSTNIGGGPVIDFIADTRRKYFWLDKGVTEGPSFSTGTNFGDGRQASRWKDSLGLGIMDPTASTRETLTITANATMAFDSVGWNLAPLPEPSTCAMFAPGLAGLAARHRPEAQA